MISRRKRKRGEAKDNISLKSILMISRRKEKEESGIVGLAFYDFIRGDDKIWVNYFKEMA